MQAILENEVPLYNDVLKVLEQPLYQNILKIISGKLKSGFVLFDSNSNKIDEILNICKRLEIPKEMVKVLDPTKPWSLKFQPFNATCVDFASDLQNTINVLLKNNDKFFRGQQIQIVSAITQLTILSFGTEATINHVMQLFLEPRYLADTVEKLRKQLDTKELTLKSNVTVVTTKEILEYFENEILDYKFEDEAEAGSYVLYPCNHKYAGRQVVENKKERYIISIKTYFNDLLSSTLMSNVFKYDDEKNILDTEQFVKEGGILLVNTATTEPEKQLPFFGQLFLTHFQSVLQQLTKECIIAGVISTPIIFYPCKAF